MNRLIKFRAWDEQKKVMHQNFQFIKSGDAGNDWIVFMADGRNFTDSVKDPYFRQQLKIMQFTGFTDQNGIEIYEGDIIYNGNDFGCICGYGEFTDEMPDKRVVKWDENDAQFKLFHLDKNISDRSASGYSFCKSGEHLFEIIGNIYEHEYEHLLKQTT